jgi:hypothetical protein
MKITGTKTAIKIFYSLLIMVVGLGACKKDALEIKEEKEFMQVNARPATDPILGTAVHLVLKPNGVASIKPGGDIVWTATYNISGKTITVKVRDTNSTYKFNVISSEEIHGEHGEILKLVKP